MNLGIKTVAFLSFIIVSCGKVQFSSEKPQSSPNGNSADMNSADSAVAESPPAESSREPQAVDPGKSAAKSPAEKDEQESLSDLPQEATVDSSPASDESQAKKPLVVEEVELSCSIPPGTDQLEVQMNTMVCTGNILASGSMKGSDLRDVAAEHCSLANVSLPGTCCAMHLFGEGEWFLTDGSVAAEGGVPGASTSVESEVAFWGRSAGPCSKDK